MMHLTTNIAVNPWQTLPPSCMNFPVRGVGVSDASDIGQAWAWNSAKRMRIVTEKVRISQAILFTEFEATYRGQMELAEDVPEESSYLWLGDNTGSIYVNKKGLSKFAKVNEMLINVYQKKEKRKVRAYHEYICSEENPVDGLSRTSVDGEYERAPCSLHPGELCTEFLEWIALSLSSPEDPGISAF